MAESVSLEPDGNAVQVDVEVSALSEQTVIDLLRRMDTTRTHQEQIKELLDGAREHVKNARDSIWFASMQALDLGHRTRLHECEQLAFSLLKEIGEVYEPEGRRSPVEPHGQH